MSYVQDTVTPEDNNITVFHMGSPTGLIACSPKGGHSHPNWKDIDIDEWKKVQKKEKKKHISDIMNKKKPHLKLFSTETVLLRKY